MVFLKLEINISPGHVLAALGSSGNVCLVIMGIGLCMAVTRPSYLASPLTVFPPEDPWAGVLSWEEGTFFHQVLPRVLAFSNNKGSSFQERPEGHPYPMQCSQGSGRGS